MSIAKAISKIPPNFYLQCAVEVNPEDGNHFLAAVIMESAPIGGWSSLDDYFDLPGYRNDGRLERYKFDDSCRVGVSANINDYESFERLIINMIHNKWPGN
jgi:hypothetical protein